MVSNWSIVFICFSLVLSVLVPIGIVMVLLIKKKISFKPLLAGILTWIVFTQVLERIFHFYMLNNTSVQAVPIIFAIYVALTAGVFEEVGRYYSFRLILRKNRAWKDGLAFGLGHGGMEALLIGGLAGLNNLILSIMINNGMYETLIKATPSIADSGVKEFFLSTAPSLFAVSGFERIFAIILHIGMTFLVLYGIRQKKSIYLLYAILAHAAFDFVAALYQVEIIKSLVLTEAIIGLSAVVIIYFIIKTKNRFADPNIVEAITDEKVGDDVIGNNVTEEGTIEEIVSENGKLDDSISEKQVRLEDNFEKKIKPLK